MEFQIVFLCMIIGLAFISIIASSHSIPDLAGHDLSEDSSSESEQSAGLKPSKKSQK